ncbi:hypothetical protein A8H33_11475 [Burkholderia vietnamiensis]|nr:hypothetical protein A8H33_11475 [Burkholderia vietnamiensis]
MPVRPGAPAHLRIDTSAHQRTCASTHRRIGASAHLAHPAHPALALARQHHPQHSPLTQPAPSRTRGTCAAAAPGSRSTVRRRRFAAPSRR